MCAPLGLTRVEEGEGLGRLEEDVNTEIESMDDSMCQDDDVPLLNCERKESGGSTGRHRQEDSLVMKFTRMTESCGSSSRRLSGSENIGHQRLESTSSETTLSTQQLTLEDDEVEEELWINEDVCPWDDESLTPTWL